MSQNLLQSSGAQGQKQPKYVPLFVDKSFTGLYTQRAPLHDPSDLATLRFYGGRPDTLWDGLNIELTNSNTLGRRPGLVAFSTATYPYPPDRIFSFHLIGGDILILVSVTNPSGGGGAVYLDNQDGTKTLIFNKAPGAGQAYFVSVGNTCFIGDGFDLVQYTPLNPNGVVWNWGIAAPTMIPTITVTESGVSSVQWKANTIFSTMGMLIDSNNNIEQLVSVNANPVLAPNASANLGETGNGEPDWNQTPGGTTTDNGHTWTNWGPIVLWTSTTTYNNGSVGGTTLNPCIIYDPGTKTCFVNAAPSNAQGTSGSKYPAFTSTVGSSVQDGTVKWFMLGTLRVPNKWQPSTSYPSLGTVHNDDSVTGIVEPGNLISGLPTNQTVYWQVNDTGGTFVSGTGGTAPPWPTASPVTGQVTPDNQLGWLCLGTADRATTTQYFPWSAQGTIFSAIAVTVSAVKYFFVCTGTGTSSNTATGSITWNTGYGQTTVDGTVTWVCVGAAAPAAWAANTTWNLPTVGFAPPSPTQPYGGSSIIDPNNGIEYVTTSGLSQTPGPPSWPVAAVPPATNFGVTTTDNTITWTFTGLFTTNSLIFTSGYSYAYSFKARAADDEDVTTAPPGVPAALGPPTGSASGHVSSTSPIFTMAVGANTGAVITISGLGSPDSQVDTIEIWRSADGGGPDNMFFLTDIQAPKPINGFVQPWSFQDFLPDVATTIANVQYPGLDNLIPAPIDNINDPPPGATFLNGVPQTTGFLPMAYHFQRIWGSVENSAFFSGGPDTIVGDPNQSFNPADTIPFLANITRMVHTPAGLVTFLTSDIECVYGGPSTASFFNTTLAPGIGLLSYNALDVHGGEIYFFSADRQALVLTPQLQISRIGFPIGDKLAAFNPADVYLTVHEAGVDNCVFIADGSTGWYRLNPHQVPQNEPIWSPRAAVTGGCQLVQSIETAPGVHQLLVGSTENDENILARSLTTFSDEGTPYDAYYVMGGIMLAHSGQAAYLRHVEFDFANPAGAATPTISFLVNSTNLANFVALPTSVSDPPQLYGQLGTASSYMPNRYYFTQAISPSLCRFLFMKVDFGSVSTAQDECYNMTIYGKMVIEL